MSAIAVDPRDGSTYVAVIGEASDSKDVRKYDADGRFLYEVDLIGNVTWLAVDDQGDVWAPGAFVGPGIHEYRFDDATQTATELRSVGTAGTGPGQLSRLTGIDVDADGNVYVCDVGNGTVHVFGPTGKWRFDIGSKALFPGDMRGVVVDDAARRLYVANSQVGTIEVFDLVGRPPVHDRVARPRRRAVPGRTAPAHAHPRRPRVGCGLRRAPRAGVHAPPARSWARSPTRRSPRIRLASRARAAWPWTARPATSSWPTTGTSASSASPPTARSCRSSANAARSRPRG